MPGILSLYYVLNCEFDCDNGSLADLFIKNNAKLGTLISFVTGLIIIVMIRVGLWFC